MNKSIIQTLFIITFLIIIGCSEIEIKSNWTENKILIDGNRNDWQNNIEYSKEEKVGIGISNDNEYLYLCLATVDNNKIMKILNNGFTVWFDPQDSDGKTIGIQYPIKKIPLNNKVEEFRKRNNQENNNENNNENTRLDKFLIDQNELLIVNEDNFPLNAYPLVNSANIEVKIDFDLNQLVYELKIPIKNKSENNFLVDVLPGENIKIGFASGEFEKPDFTGRPNIDNENPSGRSGLGGKGRMGNAEHNQRNFADRKEKLEFWINAVLSK
ncbi:MAG: hypothetical protein KDC88_01655 [Ignavibacteriae bacterium]|nr:hypothetical protein [Ignavibacteriota bacterium]MCB9210401.1 hypothetical protein [Ignavibacteriales bacterium]MCB9219206.1 hypothetical protein [Ignavibacteriales bacterium]MCB9259788.1 hypothetical protein [Ignavibacteriales bacterium]